MNSLITVGMPICDFNPNRLQRMVHLLGFGHLNRQERYNEP
jgi:hypothetical protein